jgi:uncharacterized protein
VDELFSPPGNHWQPVSSKLSIERRLGACAAGLVALVALTVLVVLFGGPAWAVASAVLVPVALTVWAWWVLGRNARSWGYAEREDDLYIRHGVMFRKLVTVPYGRMQYVDVHAGPLDQLLGIANVHLHTASPGTSAVIPGLPAQEAARLRDRLTTLGEAQAAGL